MALFSGSSGSGRRALGARPFSGREKSVQAPALRPHGDARRATAAPFQAIPEGPGADASVSLVTPSEVPAAEQPLAHLTDVPAPAPLDPERMPTLAPSVLRVDDIRSEPFGWSPPETEAEPVAEVPFDAVAHEALVEEPVIEMERVVELEAPAKDVVDEPVVESVSEPSWFDAEPEVEAQVEPVAADAPVDEAPTVDVVSVTPTLLATDVLLYDATTIEAPIDFEAAPEPSPVDDWFANDEMQPARAPEASWHAEAQVDDPSSPDVVASASVIEIAVEEETPTLETEAIAPEPVVAEEVVPTWFSPVSEAVVEEAPVVAEVPEVAPEPMPDISADASEDVASAIDDVESEGVPDEWWSMPMQPVASIVPPVVAEPLPAPRTPPVDGLAVLEALVSETQGAERAVEALEAVARMIRSREIVVSVGAGATPQSILASILASLLSNPS